MTSLILGLAIFLGVHSVSIVAPSWRDRMATRYGPAWQGAYSILAALGLGLTVVGYGQARGSSAYLYLAPPWTRDVAIVGMLAVFPLLLAAYLPGRIKQALGHPMLVAVKLWAVLHLMANGSVADLLMFGGFLVWAVADRISLKRRASRSVPALPKTRYNDLIAVLGGLALYAAFLLGGHRLITGMPILLGGP